MQFSLRTALILVFLVALATGGYINWKRATYGVELLVPNPMEVDSEIPEVITEFSSWGKVWNHDNNHPWPVVEVPVELSRYGSMQIDNVPESIRKELLDLAKSTLADESSEFRSAAIAANLLDQAGDQDAVTRILARFKNLLARDENESWKLFEVFSLKRLMAVDKSVLDLIQSKSGDDSNLGERSDAVLYRSGIDRQPLIRRHLKVAEGMAKSAYDARNSIAWLIDHAPSVEALELAEAYLLNATPRVGWGNHCFMRDVLRADFTHSHELQEVAERIERRMVAFIRESQRGQGTQDSNTIAREYLGALVDCGSEISQPMFLEMLRKPEDQIWHRDIAGALIRLGSDEQCKPYLHNVIAEFEAGKVDMHDGLTWSILCWWRDPALPALDQYEQCFGREETIKVCLGLAENHGSLVAYRKLVEMYAGTSDQELTQLIQSNLFLDGKGKNAVEALQMFEHIGNANLGELWARLPQPATADNADLFLKFYRHWHTKGLTQDDLVNWINNTLRPPIPVSVETADGLKKCPTATMDSLERFLHAGFQSQHQLAVAALSRAACGDLAFGEDIIREDVPHWISRLATELSDLKVTSCSSELQGSQRLFRLVVNRRLYQFPLAEPEHALENKYDSRCVVELLNTIALRHNLKRRFFAYPTEWGDGFCLVLFVKPAIVAELEDKFGLAPVKGCQY